MKKVTDMIDMASALREQKVDENLINMALEFRDRYTVEEPYLNRLVQPANIFYGKDVWEMAIAAILKGNNILLSGPKATGKNVLADNLACLFGRPEYNISFNVTTDSSNLIGTDTFTDNEVRLRKGPVYQCAECGGFGIFEEVNMAKNDAVSVLHSALDHRRIIDVPGYEKIFLHDATRFIGTMNAGYAGTKELNEALVSRFLVIDMPRLDHDTVVKILRDNFPKAKPLAVEQFAGLFLDLQLKSLNSEISTKAVDLRGMIAAIRTIEIGLAPQKAIRMGITYKSFDVFERDIINDVILTRIPADWTPADIF